MGDAFTPQKRDRFSFGLWTVGNVGGIPSGIRCGNPSRRGESWNS